MISNNSNHFSDIFRNIKLRMPKDIEVTNIAFGGLPKTPLESWDLTNELNFQFKCRDVFTRPYSWYNVFLLFFFCIFLLFILFYFLLFISLFFFLWFLLYGNTNKVKGCRMGSVQLSFFVEKHNMISNETYKLKVNEVSSVVSFWNWFRWVMDFQL